MNLWLWIVTFMVCVLYPALVLWVASYGLEYLYRSARRLMSKWSRATRGTESRGSRSGWTIGRQGK